MKAFRIFCAGAIALGVTLSSAEAMPQGSAPPADGNLILNVQARDCHADARRHYLPEYDRRVWHRHRANCRVVLVDPPREEQPRDCHRDVRRHYLPQVGAAVPHRHVGASCRARIYRRNDDGRPGGNCIRLGPITYCEN